MRISINKGCFDTKISIIDDNERTVNLSKTVKKDIITKIISKIDNERNLDTLIIDLAYYLKPVFNEYDICGQCGDENTYEEFEI